MDKNQQKEGKLSAMVYERAYIDAMNSCINGYKAITMWTYHLGMMKLKRLASMEAEKEDTESLVLFLRLFNEALSKVLEHESYKFNPYGIICDENSANMNAIEQVFGTMYLGKTVSCQWHFRECAKKQLSSVNPLEKETFKSPYSQICYASTASKYER